MAAEGSAGISAPKSVKPPQRSQGRPASSYIKPEYRLGVEGDWLDICPDKLAHDLRGKARTFKKGGHKKYEGFSDIEVPRRFLLAGPQPPATEDVCSVIFRAIKTGTPFQVYRDAFNGTYSITPFGLSNLTSKNEIYVYGPESDSVNSTLVFDIKKLDPAYLSFNKCKMGVISLVELEAHQSILADLIVPSMIPEKIHILCLQDTPQDFEVKMSEICQTVKYERGKYCPIPNCPLASVRLPGISNLMAHFVTVHMKRRTAGKYRYVCMVDLYLRNLGGEVYSKKIYKKGNPKPNEVTCTESYSELRGLRNHLARDHAHQELMVGEHQVYLLWPDWRHRKYVECSTVAQQNKGQKNFKGFTIDKDGNFWIGKIPLSEDLPGARFPTAMDYEFPPGIIPPQWYRIVKYNEHINLGLEAKYVITWDVAECLPVKKQWPRWARRKDGASVTDTPVVSEDEEEPDDAEGESIESEPEEEPGADLDPYGGDTEVTEASPEEEADLAADVVDVHLEAGPPVTPQDTPGPEDSAPYPVAVVPAGTSLDAARPAAQGQLTPQVFERPDVQAAPTDAGPVRSLFGGQTPTQDERSDQPSSPAHITQGVINNSSLPSNSLAGLSYGPPELLAQPQQFRQQVIRASKKNNFIPWDDPTVAGILDAASRPLPDTTDEPFEFGSQQLFDDQSTNQDEVPDPTKPCDMEEISALTNAALDSLSRDIEANEDQSLAAQVSQDTAEGPRPEESVEKYEVISSDSEYVTPSPQETKPFSAPTEDVKPSAIFMPTGSPRALAPRHILLPSRPSTPTVPLVQPRPNITTISSQAQPQAAASVAQPPGTRPIFTKDIYFRLENCPTAPPSHVIKHSLEMMFSAPGMEVITELTLAQAECKVQQEKVQSLESQCQILRNEKSELDQKVQEKDDLIQNIREDLKRKETQSEELSDLQQQIKKLKQELSEEREKHLHTPLRHEGDTVILPDGRRVFTFDAEPDETGGFIPVIPKPTTTGFDRVKMETDSQTMLPTMTDHTILEYVPTNVVKRRAMRLGKESNPSAPAGDK